MGANWWHKMSFNSAKMHQNAPKWVSIFNEPSFGEKEVGKRIRRKPINGKLVLSLAIWFSIRVLQNPVANFGLGNRHHKKQVRQKRNSTNPISSKHSGRFLNCWLILLCNVGVLVGALPKFSQSAFDRCRPAKNRTDYFSLSPKTASFYHNFP